MILVILVLLSALLLGDTLLRHGGATIRVVTAVPVGDAQSSGSRTRDTGSAKQQQQQQHTSNWAVIVSSSRYWFNYRHTVNALSIYQVLRELGGFDDDHIILLIADEYAANARNPFANQLVLQRQQKQPYGQLYNATTEIDYRGEDVTIENLVRILTMGRSGSITNSIGGPVLRSDRNSNVLIYWTGHGGDSFFKFQDVEEIMASDWARVLQIMYVHGMYRQLLFVADTCQAFTLGDKIQAPNVTWIGSSLRGESSYGHHSNYELGLSIIERYTYSLTERFFSSRIGSAHPFHSRTMDETIQKAMVDPYSFQSQRAHIGINDTLSTRKVATDARVSDFFMNVASQQKHKDHADTNPGRKGSRRRLQIWRKSSTDILVPAQQQQ